MSRISLVNQSIPLSTSPTQDPSLRTSPTNGAPTDRLYPLRLHLRLYISKPQSSSENLQGRVSASKPQNSSSNTIQISLRQKETFSLEKTPLQKLSGFSFKSLPTLIPKSKEEFFPFWKVLFESNATILDSTPDRTEAPFPPEYYPSDDCLSNRGRLALSEGHEQITISREQTVSCSQPVSSETTTFETSFRWKEDGSSFSQHRNVVLMKIPSRENQDVLLQLKAFVNLLARRDRFDTTPIALLEGGTIRKEVLILACALRKQVTQNLLTQTDRISSCIENMVSLIQKEDSSFSLDEECLSLVKRYGASLL